MKTKISPKATSYRLGGDGRTQVECLPMLGRVFLQTRNPGGGLGKWLDTLSPLVVEGFSHAFDPDAGFGFSLTRLLAMHLSAGRETPAGTVALDLDFDGHPAGVSLIEVPGLSRDGAMREFADFLGGIPVSAGDLEEWRRDIRETMTICPCCAEAAERRARHPESHPFHAILEHASICGIPLRCRLLSEHADLTAEIIPERVRAMDGFLIVNDLDDRAILHLNLRMVHAFGIDQVSVDGQRVARLRVHDMRGNLNFEISCEIDEIAGVWRALSEASDSYQWRDGD